MYIWIGCKLPESFEQEIRKRCLELNKDIGLDTASFSLPQHVSLKISFQTSQHREIIEYLSAFLSSQKPISLQILNPEQAGNILWMPVAENEQLRMLHNQLDSLLENHFGIPQHAFDKCFIFHSTLFIDPDAGKIAKMLASLEKYPTKCALRSDTFLLGLSETENSGDYRIVREIKV